MLTIAISAQEVADKTMTPEHLAAAVRAVREDGFVVLQDVVDLEHIAILRDKMIEDVKTLQARTDAPFNWNAGNVQQEAPPFAPYLFRDILLNDMAIEPPMQPQVLAGSILIRDIRLWHAGMPNRTPQPRPMIAMIHAASWLETPSLKFPRANKDFFAHPHLRTVVEWTDEPIDYLHSPQAYQYEKQAK